MSRSSPVQTKGSEPGGSVNGSFTGVGVGGEVAADIGDAVAVGGVGSAVEITADVGDAVTVGGVGSAVEITADVGDAVTVGGVGSAVSPEIGAFVGVSAPWYVPVSALDAAPVVAGLSFSFAPGLMTPSVTPKTAPTTMTIPTSRNRWRLDTSPALSPTCAGASLILPLNKRSILFTVSVDYREL